MLDKALKFIAEINDHGYLAYIVGGFVRDHILGIESNDIDVCTNAKPREIIEIFEDSCLPNEDYGSVTVYRYNIRFEVTTFREEINYINNRKPSKIKYINDLERDLKRRDFTINALCMDKDGNIIDLLNGRKDLDNKVLKAIGDAGKRLSEDCLRILRAVRFATILDFELDDKLIEAIVNNKGLLANLSYSRKKEELDKIFSSSNWKKGLTMLKSLGLDKELELHNIDKVLNVDNPIAIWAMLDVSLKYPFASSEKVLIKDIREAVKCDNLDPYTLYKYGLYVNSIAGEINNVSKKDITEKYNDLVIHKRKDINITTDDILKLLNREPGKYLSDIYNDIEQEVLYKRVDNNIEDLSRYILNKYS